MNALTKERTAALTRLFDPEKPDRAEAEEAVRTLIRWAGDDPAREGLRETPARVLRAYSEWFAGYAEDPAQYLARTFQEVAGYNEPILLRNIPFRSCCEHHMAPITGVVHVGYLPSVRIVGISKLARVVDCRTADRSGDGEDEALSRTTAVAPGAAGEARFCIARHLRVRWRAV